VPRENAPMRKTELVRKCADWQCLRDHRWVTRVTADCRPCTAGATKIIGDAADKVKFKLRVTSQSNRRGLGPRPDTLKQTDHGVLGILKNVWPAPLQVIS
jgi:hypothetical protein